MPRRVTEALHEALEEAALAGAKEIKEFLATYRGKDPDRLRSKPMSKAQRKGHYPSIQHVPLAERNKLASLIALAREANRRIHKRG